MAARAIVIGDGPGGLSAALFLAKGGVAVQVFGEDKTPMHVAMIHNYLGIQGITGPDFMKTARQQVETMGAKLHKEEVTGVSVVDGKFVVTSGAGKTHKAEYLVIAAGNKPTVAAGVGLALDDRGMIEADRNGVTSVAQCYAVGWSTRPDKIQAIISAGDGAAAALDILSKIAGKEVHDFDSLG